MHQYCLEANQLDGIFAEKILFVFLDKMYMSQQCAFVEKMYFGLHWEENCQQVKWGGTSVYFCEIHTGSSFEFLRTWKT